jgi:hypothetical protein
MKLYLGPGPHRQDTFPSAESIPGIEFIKTSPDEADMSFSAETWDTYINNLSYFHDNPNHVIHVQIPPNWRHRAGENLRINYNVDNRIDIQFDQIKNKMFSHLDFCKTNIVTYFHGPTSSMTLNKRRNYWMVDKLQKNDKFHNKVYWRGNLTHVSRKKFFNFYNKLNDTRFQIEKFGINIYTDKTQKNLSSQFDIYMNELCQTDISYVLRGDRPWANSFYDVIRAGCIPVMISSMNDFGWENIMSDVDDYFLRFDIRTQPMEYIHEQVCKLLEDEDRVLQMKANIRKLYKTFFHHPGYFGTLRFCWGKCLEIYKNNYDLCKVDDKFICYDMLELMGIQNKI